MDYQSLLKAASFSPNSIVNPGSWVGHLPFAWWIIQQTKPKIFVELGTHTGNSYFSFCQSVSEHSLDTKCFSVDTWKGDSQAGYYDERVFEEVNNHNQANYAEFSTLLRMKFDSAVNLFADGSVELIHIDGFHSYEAVKYDFETWLPKLSPNAVVLFHDVHVLEPGFGVHLLWRELQEIFPNNMSFVHSHGLGVLQLNSLDESDILSWLKPNCSSQKMLQKFFAGLGAHHLNTLNHETHKARSTVEIEDRDQEINVLKLDIEDRDQEINILKSDIEDRDQEINILKLDIEDRDQEINALLAEKEAHEKRTNKSPGHLSNNKLLTILRHIKMTSIFNFLIDYIYRIPKEAIRKKFWYYTLKNAKIFDAEWYLKNYEDVASSGVDPLKHYIAFGWHEGRNPSPSFDTRYYSETHTDVDKKTLPLFHYFRHGRHENRAINPTIGSCHQPTKHNCEEQTRPFSNHEDTDELISVVIPTYNRRKLLPEVLDAWRGVNSHTRVKYEIIFSDDGSDDGTIELLEAVVDLPIKVLKNKHGGASRARNAAIRVANGQRLLIMGDDIFPAPDILEQHTAAAKKYGDMVATLGFVEWHDALPVNHLMTHITEIGNEQFSFNRLLNGSFTDFRHFYTCNICVPKHFFDEQDVLFDERFTEYGFEDIELGYRLALNGMKILYTEDAAAQHFHPYTVDGFVKRQISAGRMAIIFSDIHPEIGNLIGKSNIKYQAKNEENLWERRLRLIIKTCEEYEQLIQKFPHEATSEIKRALSIIYSQLFKAMYTYGLLQKEGKSRYPLTHVMSNHFSKIPDYFWEELKTKLSKKANLSYNEMLHLNESLKNLSFTNSSLNEQQKAIFDEVSQLKELNTVSTIVARKLNLSFILYAIRLCISNPRLFLGKVRSYYSKSLKQKKHSKLNLDTAPVVSAIPGLVLDADFDNKTKLNIISSLKELFGEFLQIYELNPIGLLNEFGSDEHVPIQSIDATVLFWPRSIKFSTNLDRLLNGYLALVENSTDLSIISHSLKFDETVTISDIRDHLIFSKTIASQVFSNDIAATAFTGKILRTSSNWGDEKRVELSNIFGTDLVINDCGLFRGNQGSNRKEQKFMRPCLPLHQKTKPVIFVFPIFLAVGGVERNTIEIMRVLKERFDFVVITMERLRHEQGSLVSQAQEVSMHVIEMAELVEHAHFIRLLQDFKYQYNPDLIWICNGSPWLSDNALNIRHLFNDIPIIDQQAYDAQIGWIEHYPRTGISTFDKFIAVNTKILDRFLVDFKLGKDRTHLIYSAIDTKHIIDQKQNTAQARALVEKYELPTEKNLYTFVGRLTDQKQPIKFLNLALSRVNNPDEFYVLVGDGELSDEIDNFITENALSNIKRIPYLANTLALHSISSGIIFTSSYEGLPIAMLEAIAMGVPVFSTNVGDISDILHKYNGGKVISPTVSHETFITEFEDWISNRGAYTKSLKAFEKDILDFFSSENIAIQYAECWNNAIVEKKCKK